MALDWKLVIDTADAHRVADFWAAALEYEVEDNSALIARLLAEGHIGPEVLTEHHGRRAWREMAAVRHPDDPVQEGSGIGLGRRLLFQNVPERRTSAKNRLHIDIHSARGERSELVARLEGLGATVLREVDEGLVGRWTVMADPEGNEFCAA